MSKCTLNDRLRLTILYYVVIVSLTLFLLKYGSIKNCYSLHNIIIVMNKFLIMICLLKFRQIFEVKSYLLTGNVSLENIKKQIMSKLFNYNYFFIKSHFI